MSDTTASLRRKISSAGDLQSVVRTMKALAASSIGQYEKSVRALGDYYRTVELGLGACFRESEPATLMVERKGQTDAGAIGAVVFGSDQGLVGQFNDVVADFAVKTLAALPGKPQVWAVGERVHARLTDAGLPPMGLFTVPNSVQAITPLVGRDSNRKRSAPGRRRVCAALRLPQPPAVRGALRTGQPAIVAARRALGTRSGQSPLADKDLARSHGWRHRDAARTHPRISFHLALPGVRRIPREREREPPGGDAARRQKHRRLAGGSPRHVPPFAPERHRRGTVRRDLRLRGAQAPSAFIPSA